ncbi:MAG TPA: pirin family protein [Blastocatellia bacterium]|nr:pirin family protein [Blastocatellia bacterium]
MTDYNHQVRSVESIVQSMETLEGEGFLVHRPFPTAVLTDFDPFLLLDEMGPKDLAPGEAKGAPDHPHRGFETVTYMLEGRMEHKDSQGNAGRLTPGDVQWMTAGAGVVHSEMPERDFASTGGRLHGFQLWVNLLRRDKMTRPRYQEIPAARIPTAETADGRVTVKVIAGEALGTRAVIETRTPIIYLHFTLQPGARIAQPLPAEYNGFAYVVAGAGRFGADAERAVRGQMVVFSRDGDEVLIENAADATAPLSVLLIAGVPLGEPVARYGPFVMNTKEEIYQAFADYRSGRMGEINF